MKFGFRKPSLKKRIAARTSLKRYVRHNLGLKAPRGWGWVTNPKKAAYNRVYNRTTVDATKLVNVLGTSSPTTGGGGCGGVLLLLALLGVGVAVFKDAFAPILVLAILIGGPVYLFTKWRARKNAEDAQQVRFQDLERRFGTEAATDIMDGVYWQGGTMEMVEEALGPPEDIKERVFKTKTKTTYYYQQVAKNRFALKIHFENGKVVGWDET